MRAPLFGIMGLAVVCGTAHAQSAASSDTVVVTASPLAGDKDRFATIVETVSRDKILAAGGGNLADALSDVPGVANTSFAAGASRPVIRGMDANRVKILEDGLGSSDVSEIGPDHGVPIDPLSARSIEVVRGAATLRYGSQAIGGVVNAINNRVPSKLPEETSGEMSASFSSATQSGEGSLLVDKSVGNVALHADGFVRNSGDYSTPFGIEANTFMRARGLAAGGSYISGESHAGLAVVDYNATYGIPAEDAQIEMRQTKAISNSSLAIGAGPLKTFNFDLSYADYNHSEIDPATGDKLSTFINREWDGRGELLLDAIGPLAASAIGVQAQDRKFSAQGEGADFMDPSRTKTQAFFAFTEAPLGEKLNLQAAARVENTDIEGTPVSGIPTTVSFTPVSGSAGVLFTISDALKLGFTASSAARAPGVVELFAKGPHEGPLTFETGDPNLKIERANSVEGTIRIRAGGLTFDGSAWNARFTDYIYGALTGNLCDEDGDCSNPPDAELQELFYAQRDANFWGLEGKASLDMFSTAAGVLSASALADMVEANFTGGGGPVPRIQPWRVGGGLSWSSDIADAGVTAIYVGKRNDVAFAETPTDGHWELNAQAAWRLMGEAKGLELALIGHNLTNEVQRNAVALNKDLVMLPGRDVRLVLRGTF